MTSQLLGAQVTKLSWFLKPSQDGLLSETLCFRSLFFFLWDIVGGASVKVVLFFSQKSWLSPLFSQKPVYLVKLTHFLLFKEQKEFFFSAWKKRVKFFGSVRCLSCHNRIVCGPRKISRSARKELPAIWEMLLSKTASEETERIKWKCR